LDVQENDERTIGEENAVYVRGIKISSIYTLHLPNTCFAIKKDTDKFKNLSLSIRASPTFVGTTSSPRPTESLEEAPRVFG